MKQNSPQTTNQCILQNSVSTLTVMLCFVNVKINIFIYDHRGESVKFFIFLNKVIFILYKDCT